MPPADEHTDPVNALLEQCLDAPLAKQQDVLDTLARAHPELEGELRDRYRQLRDVGLLKSVGGVMRATEVAQLSRGSMFGDFRILRELGCGGMGVVYLAEQVSMRRQVALKLLRADALADTRIRQRFHREVEAASSLEHSGISTIYAAGEVRGTPYIAMRYVPGETLRSRIRAVRGDADESSSASSKSSTQAETMEFLCLVEQIARALHYAHERGFIHRDVKPGNVIVTDGDEPVLLDFGLARPEDHTGDSLTLSGDALGTPAYMAPEQISPNGQRIDRRADVYSLGVTLYECLTGHTPFAAATREELYRLILTTGRVDTGKHRLPRDLQVVLHTALARERDQRYQTALDFANDLERIRQHKPIAARPVSLAERAWSWTRREPLKAALLVIVPLLCLLGGYVWARSDEIHAGAEALQRLQLDVALARGFAGLETGAPEDAEAAFRAARSVAPADREAAAGLAMSLRVQDKGAAADTLIAELGPASFEARCVNAWFLIMKPGKDAEQHSLESLSEPKTATEYFLLGTAALKHDNNHHWQKRAQAAFLKAVARSKRARMHYYVGLVFASRALRDAAWIRTGSQTMVELWPDQPLAWAIVAGALDRIDRDAARTAGKELERWPNDVFATYTRGRLALAMNDPERAALLLEQALGKTWYRPYLWCARAFWEAGDTDRAVAVMEQAVTRFPNRSVVRAHLAEYQKDHRAAEAAYRKMIEQYPDNSSAHAGLAQCLDRRGHANALRHAQRAIELDATSHKGQRVLARALFRAGQRDKARRIAARLLETDADDKSNWDTAAHLALRGGDYSNAAAFYRRSAQLRPHLTSHYNFGLAEQRLGHYRKAVLHYQKLLARTPGHAESHINLGLSLFCMRDVEGALPMLEKGEDLGKKRKGWKSFAGWIARVRKTLENRPATRPSGAAIASLSLDEARHLADEAYWQDEDRRCVEAFRHAVSEGLPWTPRFRFTIRWAAHAAVRIGDATFRGLAREWLDRLLCGFESHATSAKPRLRLLMHQELYSWLSHERMAPVREGTGLENLPEEEQAKWRSFWTRAQKLATTLDPWPWCSPTSPRSSR